MKILGCEVNMMKVAFTVMAVIVIVVVSSAVVEMLSAAKAGLAVHQLNGTDVEYAFSTFVARLQGITAFVLSILAILFIWRKEIVKGINSLKHEEGEKTNGKS